MSNEFISYQEARKLTLANIHPLEAEEKPLEAME
jgi:hypothetical protein